MSGIAAAIGVSAVAGLAGAAMSASAAGKASKAQAQAAQSQIASQERMLERQIELQEPFRQAGLTAQNRLMTLLGLPGEGVSTTDPEFNRYGGPFTMAEYTRDPGYNFRFAEGVRAAERSAAARGGLMGGAQLRALTRYGQDMGSQEYQNAFNRYYTSRSNVLAPLQGFLGQGQMATNQTQAAMGQAGQNISQGYGNLGQAQASGYVGQANAINQGVSGISNAANQYMQNQMMMRMFPQTAGVGNSPYSYGAGGYTGYGPFMG